MTHSFSYTSAVRSGFYSCPQRFQMSYKVRQFSYDEDHYSPRVYVPMGKKLRHDDRYTYTSSSATVEKEERGCFPWLKYAIYGANVVFCLVGTLLLAMGVWLRTDSRFREFLSERYRQVVAEAFWEAPTLFIFSYIMIVLGCCMIVVAFFGFCGVTGVGSRVCLIVYSIAVFLLLIFTLASGIFLLYKRDGIDVEVSDALNYMVQHYYQGAGIVQESLDRLQQTFRCCGNAGCSDFRMFRQDPPRSCDIRCDGCHYRIMVALQIGFSITLVVFLAVVLIQVMAICVSIYLVFTQPSKVKLLYVERIPRAAPLTRENIARHDVPEGLPKHRRYY